MSDDIVARLRDPGAYIVDYKDSMKMCADAADALERKDAEIAVARGTITKLTGQREDERLRANFAEGQARGLRQQLESKDAEIAKLRAALIEARKWMQASRDSIEVWDEMNAFNAAMDTVNRALNPKE